MAEVKSNRTRLRLSFDNGTDEKGKSLLLNKTLNNLADDVSNENCTQAGNLLSAIVSKPYKYATLIKETVIA